MQYMFYDAYDFNQPIGSWNRNQSGGIGGEDVSSLLLTLDIDLDPTIFPCLMALDFTKAFDSCDYTLALAVMSRLGLPVWSIFWERNGDGRNVGCLLQGCARGSLSKIV
jgi:hypothetical protein